jgi:type IV secretion system protein VirB10
MTTPSSNPPQQPPAAAPAPVSTPATAAPAPAVRIPNVAALHSPGLPRKTIAMAVGAVVVACAAVAAGTWKLAQWQRAGDQARAEQEQERLAAEELANRRRVKLDDTPATPPPRASEPASAPRHNDKKPEYALDDLQPAPMQRTGQPAGGSGAGTYAGASGKPAQDPRDATMLLSSRARAAAAPAAPGGAVPMAGNDAELEQMKASLRQQAAVLLQDSQRRMQQHQQQQAPVPVPVPVPAPAAPGFMPMNYVPGRDMPAPAPVPMPQAAQRPPVPAAQPPQQRDDEPVQARMLGDLSLTAPAGDSMVCHLATKVITSTAGEVKCVLARELRGADGQVVLAEKGSVLTGNYQMVQIQPGIVTIPATWTRLRTPRGVVVNIDSPATGPLGEGGIPAHVNNRWVERIGASVLLSLLDGVVRVAVNASSPDSSGATVVLGSTAQGSNRIAEEVLNATIKIKPLLTANQGDEVAVLLQRDLSFAGVYRLRPAALPR